jgi:alkylation response protein AidB-like acyl-CoA dehydrogenase
MNFSLNDDQLALRDAVRRFVDTSSDPTQLAKLGVLGLTMPEQVGGSGLSAIEAMLVAIELGRGLMAAPWQVASVQAGVLIQNAMLGNKSADLALNLLTQMASGSTSATLAYAQEGAQYQANLLTGECRHVLEAKECDWLFVLIAEPACWLMIDARENTITKKTFTLLDGTQGAHFSFKQTPVHHVVAQGDTALTLCELVRCHSDAAYCAEALGVMQKLLELTTEHLKTRQQFGSPLAKFQALQHQLADQIVRYELFASLVALAAMAVAEIDSKHTSTARRYSSAAIAYLSQHCRPFCETIIQMHGAMGVTDENPVGKLVKRILLISHWHGDSTLLRERYRQSLPMVNQSPDKVLL